MKMQTICNLTLAIVLLVPVAGYAEEASDSDLAKKTQNPLSNLISLPLQNNFNFGVGPNEDMQYRLNIQPVWPFEVSDEWNVITRTIVPFISQAGIATGLGDTTFTAFLSPRDAEKVIWGAGPAVLIPTATNDGLGRDRWGAGPSLVVLTMPGQWVIGSIFSNVWSFAGSGTQDINLFTWQYFINYNFSSGWYLTSAPIMTANWLASAGNVWTVPVGGGAGKVVRFGKLPVNLSLQGFTNVAKPQFGTDWSIRFQMQFLFPK